MAATLRYAALCISFAEANGRSACPQFRGLRYAALCISFAEARAAWFVCVAEAPQGSKELFAEANGRYAALRCALHRLRRSEQNVN
jgi:hypothetical protein